MWQFNISWNGRTCSFAIIILVTQIFCHEPIYCSRIIHLKNGIVLSIANGVKVVNFISKLTDFHLGLVLFYDDLKSIWSSEHHPDQLCHCHEHSIFMWWPALSALNCFVHLPISWKIKFLLYIHNLKYRTPTVGHK